MQGYFYYYNSFKPNRLIVFDHGMWSGHMGYMKEIEMLARHGYLVYSYDHTGCMESGGDFTNGFAQSLHDLDNCLSALEKLSELKDYEISVMGHKLLYIFNMFRCLKIYVVTLRKLHKITLL